MKRLLMAEQWDQFARSIQLHQAPEIQRKQMKRAFYAGGYSLLFSILHALAAGAEPTVGDLQMMKELHDELHEFGTAVKEGRA